MHANFMLSFNPIPTIAQAIRGKAAIELPGLGRIVFITPDMTRRGQPLPGYPRTELADCCA